MRKRQTDDRTDGRAKKTRNAAYLDGHTTKLYVEGSAYVRQVDFHNVVI